MKVAIDARYVNTTDREVRPSGGIGRYVYRLVQELLEVDPTLRLRLIVPATNRRPIVDRPNSDRVEEQAFGAPPQSLGSLLAFAGAVDLRDVDVVHCPANVLPFGLSTPTVTTIHDLMWLDAPELCASFWGKRLITGSYYRIGLEHAARTSAHVLTVSKASREALVQRFPGIEQRTTVTYHGLDPTFVPLEPAQAEKATRHIVRAGTEFVLCVGQGSPYKNHARGVLAFAEAFASEPEVKLVLVRRFTRWDTEMRSLLSRHELQGRVITLPEITEPELHALYARARIFLFPSLCEGFGLPALEAMACGVPVLSANFGAMAVVSGGAALGVDTHSVAAIANGLKRLFFNERLREELIERGHRRVRDFSWRTCAERTLSAYRQAAGFGGFLPRQHSKLRPQATNPARQ